MLTVEDFTKSLGLRGTFFVEDKPEDGQCTIRFSDDYATVNKTLPEIKGMLVHAAREVLTNG